jgi:hypothetical protein
MYTRCEVQVHHPPFHKDCSQPYPIRGYRFRPPRMVACYCRLSVPCETTRVTLQTRLQRAFQRVTLRDGTWMQEHHHGTRPALHKRKGVSIAYQWKIGSSCEDTWDHEKRMWRLRRHFGRIIVLSRMNMRYLERY